MTMHPAVEKFLGEPHYAVIATIRPDGFPMTVITWYEWRNGRILINMNVTRARLRWLRANPRVGLTIRGGALMRHVRLFGSIVDVQDDSELADIDRLCLPYTGLQFAARDGRRVSR